MLGRTFLADEDQHGRNRALVLDHGYWQRRFGGDPKIVGKTLILNHEPWHVVGITRPEFRAMGLTAYPIYTAYAPADHPDNVNVNARLRQGETIEAARAELSLLAGQVGPDSTGVEGSETDSFAIARRCHGVRSDRCFCCFSGPFHLSFSSRA